MSDPTQPNLMQRMGDAISNARIAAGKSQQELADDIGCSKNHLSKLERGLHWPRATQLERLMSSCDCQLNITISEK